MTNQELRELLELAAKACGYQFLNRRDYLMAWSEKYQTYFNWEPHLDDGDGARMEAALDIDVQWSSHSVFAIVYTEDADKGWIEHREFFTDHNSDKQAARRTASLRVAAAVGKRMGASDDIE